MTVTPLEVGRAIYEARGCEEDHCTFVAVNGYGYQLIEVEHNWDCSQLDHEGRSRYHVTDKNVTITDMEIGRVIYRESLDTALVDVKLGLLPYVSLR